MTRRRRLGTGWLEQAAHLIRQAIREGWEPNRLDQEIAKCR